MQEIQVNSGQWKPFWAALPRVSMSLTASARSSPRKISVSYRDTRRLECPLLSVAQFQFPPHLQLCSHFLASRNSPSKGVGLSWPDQGQVSCHPPALIIVWSHVVSICPESGIGPGFSLKAHTNLGEGRLAPWSYTRSAFSHALGCFGDPAFLMELFCLLSNSIPPVYTPTGTTPGQGPKY